MHARPCFKTEKIILEAFFYIDFDWHEHAYEIKGRMVYWKDKNKLTAVPTCSGPDQVQYLEQDHWGADHILACFA
jgi:hypothetical protein